jgi:hypothetical protein
MREKVDGRKHYWIREMAESVLTLVVDDEVLMADCIFEAR